MDETLADIEAGGERDARFWVQRIANRGLAIREEALSRLVTRGILESRDDRFLWVFRSRRYPAIDGEPEREVKMRIMDVLFSDEIPDPRDVVIISLAHACDIFNQLLSRADMDRAYERIEQIRKLDMIGQAMSQAIPCHRTIHFLVRASRHVLGRRRQSSGHPRHVWPLGRREQRGCRRLGRVRHDLTQPLGKALLSDLQVVLALQTHPEARGVTEVAREQ